MKQMALTPEQELALQVEGVGLVGGLQREHPFALDLGRRWRFDFAWPGRLIACEVEGAVGWASANKGRRGRHVRPEGFESDCIKYATALVLGWKVVRVTPRMIRAGDAITLLELLLKGETDGRLPWEKE